jgi:hypothetical protein
MRPDPSAFVGYGMTTFQVGGSSVSGPFGAVRYAGAGTVEGEGTQDAESFGAPGIICRPRPPSTVTGLDGSTQYDVGLESVGARMGDSIRPVAYRDLRLNRAFPAPAEGTMAFVGYGGGFLSFSDDAAKQSITTLYVPYDFDGDGVPAKCHTIVLDPQQEKVAVIQGDGRSIILGPDGIVMRCDRTTHVTIGPGTCTIIADKIILQGNVCAGADSVGAVPLTPGVSSPSFFVSVV